MSTRNRVNSKDLPTAEELTSEVERLRGEIEALKLEHIGCKPLYSRRKLEAQLTEATALLERVDEALESDGPWLALQAQLRHWLATRAPAQPAAPTHRPRCAEHEVPLANEAFFKCGCRYLGQPAAPTPGRDDLRMPAAPEPSAEPVAKERYLLQCEVAESLRVKLLAAEAQLVAVRSAFAELPSPEQLRTDKRLTMDAKAALADLIELLTPAPSPGAGEKP